MILENYTGSLLSGDVSGIGSFVGEPHELIETAMESTASVHNLNLALARVEHRCIVENVGIDVLNEGVREFFTRMKETIEKYWRKFVNWLQETFERIRSTVFGPRRKWLDDNEDELNKLSAFGNDAEYKVGKRVGNSGATNIITKSVSSASDKAMGAIDTWAANDALKPDDLRKQIEGIFNGKPLEKDKTLAKSIDDYFVGEEETRKIDAAGVKKMITEAKNTFLAGEQLPELQKISAAMISKAEATQKMGAAALGKSDEAGKKKSGRVLEGISTAGPVIQSAISSYIGIISKVNAQSMGYLVRALAAGRAEKGNAKNVNASTSLLSAYM